MSFLYDALENSCWAYGGVIRMGINFLPPLLLSPLLHLVLANPRYTRVIDKNKSLVLSASQ